MPDLTTADIERLLRDSRHEIAYPPTPDLATRALDRIRPTAPDRSSSVGLIATTPPQRSASRATTQPIPLHPSRPNLPGQLVRLAAAILAFVVAGGLLVAVFGLTGNGEDDRQGAPAIGAANQDRLYVLTEYGTFTAYDAETREELYSLDVSYASQAAMSPDGARFYLTTPATDTNPGSLIALNAEDGSLIWRAPQTMSPVGYINDGPPSMALSADGSRLYLYVYRRNGDTFVGYSIRTIDAMTGATIGEAETTDGSNSGCAPQLQASQSNGRVFLTCWAGYRLRIFDLGMARFTYDIDLPTRDTIGSNIQSTDSIVGAAQSSNGRYLYVVSDGPRINVVNTGPGELEATHDIPTDEPAPVHRGLVALSEDGTRLAIGLQTVAHDNGLHDVGRIIVVDTTTWQPVADLNLDPALHDPPMTGHAMTFSPDGSALYVSTTEYEDGTVNVVKSSSVVKIDIATGEREVVIESDDSRTQVWRVFSGRVGASQSPDMAGQDDAWPSMLLLDLNPDVAGRDKLQIRPVDPTTLDDVAGLQPISVGQHWQQALSPDGRTLAAFTWPTQEPEWGSLRLLDLETWQTTIAPITNIPSVSNLAFTEDGASLYWIAGNYVEGELALWRYDLATEQASIVTRLPDQLSPSEIREIAGERLAIYGVPMDNTYNVRSGTPRVLVVDFNAGTVLADVELEGITAGQQFDGAWRTHRPGLAWDTERGLLYVVHATDDLIMVVDLNRGVIAETTAFAPQQSLSDRLFDWLVPTAAAKGGPASGRIMVLSDDGQRLFIGPYSDRNTWFNEDLNQYPLQIIDTDNLKESREIDLPTIGDMRLSPDGSLLVLQTYVHATNADGQPMKANQQFVGLSVDDLRDAGEIELPGNGESLRPTTNYEIAGFSADSRSMFAIRRTSTDDSQSVDLLAIDLETWEATVERTLDETWFGELVMPVR